MKVKVLKTFINKYSKNIYKKGEIIDVTEKRFKEINSTEYGVLAEKIREPKK